MNFNEYQEKSKETDVSPKMESDLIYPSLGLVGEAGEIAGKIKKIFRDDNGILTEERRQMLKKELGDVLWYISQLAAKMDLDLNEIAEYNVSKLQSRMKRGTLKGDGDER